MCSSVVTQEEIELRRSLRTALRLQDQLSKRLQASQAQVRKTVRKVSGITVLMSQLLCMKNQWHSIPLVSPCLCVHECVIISCPYCVSGGDLFVLCEEAFSCVTCTYTRYIICLLVNMDWRKWARTFTLLKYVENALLCLRDKHCILCVGSTYVHIWMLRFIIHLIYFSSDHFTIGCKT